MAPDEFSLELVVNSILILFIYREIRIYTVVVDGRYGIRTHYGIFAIKQIGEEKQKYVSSIIKIPRGVTSKRRNGTKQRKVVIAVRDSQ